MNITAQAQRLFRVSIALSVLLAVGLGAAYFAYDSELALAHGADSLADVVTAAGLSIALTISAVPPDDDHPFGHHGAQPIAALMVAVLTGVLAVGVAREAVAALLGWPRVALRWPLAGVLATKVVAKAAIAWAATRLLRRQASSALKAFVVDARNDVLAGILSIGGFIVAHYGELPLLDAWLALPMAVMIGVSGVTLAQESIALLMGSAPPEERRQALVRIAAAVSGVVEVGQLRAYYHGHYLHVLVEIRVAPDMTVGQAHDVGEAVERALRKQDDVASAAAHMEAARSCFA